MQVNNQTTIDPNAEVGYVDDDNAEEEMPQAERELADDAQWKIIQKNTFTRWANEHLKQANKALSDLQSDLSDGLRLVALIEVLSGHQFKHVNKRPSFRTQKLENVTMVLKFLEDHEGLRLVNIDSTDIVDCRLKLILGLIWTLILHYSISLPMWEGEEELPQDEKGKGPTPKQRLMAWLNTKMPDKPIKNFTTDWNDGIAIGALVDACAPGLCPDWTDWEPKQALRNATEAIDAAEQWLEVPQLIKPEEMINPKVDEKAMMTYLSQFPNAKLKQGAPLRPKTNPARVRAYGPGLEPQGNTVGAPARFTIDTFSAGRGNVEVLVLNPKGIKENCEVIANNDKNLTYSCAYMPTMEGEYRVIIKFASKEVPHSPFKIVVEGSAGDPSKVTANGPGIELVGNVVGRRTFFNIVTANAGAGTVDCVVLDAHGRRDVIKPRITRQSEESYLVEYTPKDQGQHSVQVFFAGQQLSVSPYTVGVTPSGATAASGAGITLAQPTPSQPSAVPQTAATPAAPTEAAPGLLKSKAGFTPKQPPSCQPDLAYVTGRGVQAKGVRIRDVADFQVHTEKAGEGELVVKVTGPGGTEERVQVKKSSTCVYECSYTPHKPGVYTVTVQYGGGNVQRSPFKVEVGPYKETKICAYGPGLKGGTVNQPAIFTVETSGETGHLGFSIEGPSEAKIDCSDNGDGSANVIYWPTVPGEYAVHILCNEEDIPKSPYMSTVTLPASNCDATRVKAYGPGLESSGQVNVSRLAEFTIDIRDAGGPAPLVVECYGQKGESIPVHMRDKADGTFACSYTPRTTTKHTIYISYGGIAIPHSPFKVEVTAAIQPNKVKVSGPGIESAVRNQRTHFIADTREAGSNEVGVIVTDEKGQSVPVDSRDNGDGTVRVEYTPTSTGTYTVQVLLAGTPVPHSPFKVRVEAGIDLNKIRVDKLEKGVFKESFAKFIVDAKAVDHSGQGTVKAIVTSPTGQRTSCLVDNKNDGTYNCSYSPVDEGPHKIDVTYEGLPVPGSPFPVQVRPGCDPTRVHAFGPGLEGGLTNQPAVFTVDLDGAGQGGLGLAIEGPADAPINCTDNRDGTCTVEYRPTMPGTYDVYIKFNEQDIPGSPYHVAISDRLDASQVRCFGPGVEPHGPIRVRRPANFTVDASRAGVAPLQVLCSDARTNPSNPARPAQSLPHGPAHPGLYEVTYLPETEGPCHLDVLYGGQPVPGSPFTTVVRPATEPERVRVWGQGVGVGAPGPEQGTVGVLHASLPTVFAVDAREAGEGDLELAVLNPEGRPLQVTAKKQEDGTLACHYQPKDVGQHSVSVRHGGRDVPHSPFKVNATPVGRADKCRFEEAVRKQVAVGQECVITVNTSQAGQGQLTCRIIAPDGTELSVEVSDNGNGTVSIYYTPTQPGEYAVEIKFGGQVIPDGRPKQTAVPPEQLAAEQINAKRSQQVLAEGISVTNPAFGSAYLPVQFKLPTPANVPLTAIHAIVARPSGAQDVPSVVQNPDGTVTVQYQPTEGGMHDLTLTCNGRPINGSPFRFFVETGVGRVTAHGPGLSHGCTGQPAEFTVITRDAGSGGLSLAVEGPSKAEIQCRDNNDGTCSVSYLPLAPGDYHVIIKFKDNHIPGSPYTAKILGEVRKRAQVSIGTTSDVPLKITGTDISTLTASVKSPSGREEPCILKRIPHDHLGISFTPKEVGEHLVNVYQGGTHIPNSPFKIVVGENEIADAGKVRVYGPGIEEGTANQTNKFTVDTRSAGYGGLSLSIEGPSKADIECQDNEDGTCLVTYRPTEPGTYLVNVKYADQHIPGSPFAVNIGGEPSAKLMERITRRREAADVTHVGSQCELSLRIPGTSPLDMMASVTSPSGMTELCDIVDLGEGHYSIKFVPKEMGVHTVAVRHRNTHIPGSPFQFTVGPITEGGSHKVMASGPGLQQGVVGASNEFSIYTREAGAGGLSIAIEGPSKAEIDFEDRKDGSCGVNYRVSEPGDYVCSIKFNDEHIPNSPFRVYVGEEAVGQVVGGIVSSVVTPFHEKELQIGRPAAFTVNFANPAGTSTTRAKLTAYVHTPSGAEEAAVVQYIDDDQYAVRFIPRENGPHLIFIMTEDNVPIPGSPFRILVGQYNADPAMVHATGEGLTRGHVGVKNRFFVNTVNAGSGALNVTVDGPSKVQLNCHEHDDGYEFTYLPTVPGEYQITVKYGGNFHIVGSPFHALITDGESETAITSQQIHLQQQQTAQVEQQSHVVVETVGKTAQVGRAPLRPDAHPELVHCYGIGIKRGFVDRVNQFNVDASSAGIDMLLVGVAGPQRPCEEVTVKHTGNNQFAVTYRVKERGRHILIVKWGEQHVPGSPFVVEVP